ncbi:hypothetical protein HPGCJGGD_0801 [Methylobacterium haplocladii]|uniref:hypothetical protein n=1 Tax=Methylobacterium haplocladii TaxID=1176176 RepID=UPI001EDEE6A7|nr:hypothetical protein [Methylobacterium haplocladii]GJD82939.1 hypothetical protein HPGCJGGD_0801 [Methylobacterium haplocladii]
MSATNSFRSLSLIAAVLPAVFVTACIPVQAAASDVVVQWGDAVVAGAQTLSTVLIPLAVTAAAAAAARMAGPLRFLVTTTLVERLVRNASDYALNAVAGAVRGKSLTIPLGSAVARLKIFVFISTLDTCSANTYDRKSYRSRIDQIFDH